MKNEPVNIKMIRDRQFEGVYFDNGVVGQLLNYIDQLQGLLDGTLMYNSQSPIVPRVPMSNMKIGDMWYIPMIFSGPMSSDILFEDVD